MASRYKETVFLPETAFPMKAGLPRREPDLLKHWEKMSLYQRLREQAKGREVFLLHDGPPYANGHLHIGHALNKILKDIVNRFAQMQGKDARYVPGWDCHGLPIEWKIEEKYRAAGKDKDAVSLIDFREECRAFARHWIDVQRDEFQRLGVLGDWENPYATIAFDAEAKIVEELGKFLINGGLYKGKKPVMWSVVEKTALAEAEVEYHDHTSTQIYVRFPVTRSSDPALEGAGVVIWTTTPWTIPGNRAVAYGEAIDYVLIEVTGAAEKSLARTGEKLLFAEALLESSLNDAAITHHTVLHRLKGKTLAGTSLQHPLYEQGYDFEVPLLAGEHVTVEQGSGFVHTAPGHGLEDFTLGQRHGLEVPETVGDDGRFYEHVPLFASEHVFKVDPKIVEALQKSGNLLWTGKMTHAYPHSWRSKAPLIFRTTPQWFISMETNDLRKKALDAIEATRWVPKQARNRMFAMVSERPDWCVSRQRAWGIPIAVFVDRKTGEPLRDPKVMERIVQAIAKEGADAWFTSPPERFLGNDYAADDFEPIREILDVWFESGATHAFVLEAREDLSSPASLYLEGSDQHRGWFQSSLLESCGTRGGAPFDAVLTHGFVLGEDSHKMSKSLGNVVSPLEVVKDYGADILRLWVGTSDYTEDLRIGPEILKHQVDMYRRFRNTLRYLLGSLKGFDAAERIDNAAMPELERWIHHRLWEIDRDIRKRAGDYDYTGIAVILHNFCAVELSALYFDIRKDSIYCDAAENPRRRAARTVMDDLFHCLTAWLAPILCFTAEEAWLARFPGTDESVHLRLFPDVPEDWRDDALAAKWEKVRALRRVVTGALEIERAEKRIGSSLAAAPRVFVEADYIMAMKDVDPTELFITSGATLEEGTSPEDGFRLAEHPGITVLPVIAKGEKCERCWRVLEEVGSVKEYEDLCRRCAEVVAKSEQPRE
ncbi:MAG: isoleucine--tRNA ligase [Alphaproteobacteria bacterium]|nr:isoleucine--tRNA ligase [Alphaproteobacteria bacterium]